MGILNERTRESMEVDTVLRVEYHCLLGSPSKVEFHGASQGIVQFRQFGFENPSLCPVLRYVAGPWSPFHPPGRRHHHGAFAALHFASGEFKKWWIGSDDQDVVLLVADHVDALVDAILFVFLLQYQADIPA